VGERVGVGGRWVRGWGWGEVGERVGVGVDEVSVCCVMGEGCGVFVSIVVRW
jgi:hypothetical protein